MSTTPRVSAAKRDWGHDTSNCNILHIDMDAFYASIEIARHPELKGKPVIVGDGPRSVVSAASYEARAYGVNSAMPTAKARRLCPDGIFLPVDMEYYQFISSRIFDEIFCKITDQIEKVSIDECYMDVHSAMLRWSTPIEIGRWIRNETESRFHLTCSIGIASNKLIAKMASTNAKPDGMLLIPENQNANFVSIMPLRAIPGIGSSISRSLKAWGINDIYSLRTVSEETLQRITGSYSSAHMLYQSAHGIDERQIVNNAKEKSIGTERTFDYDTTDIEEVNKLLRYCCNEVARSLRKHELVAYTVTLKLRFGNLHYVTRSRTMRNATDVAYELYKQVTELLNAINPQIKNTEFDDTDVSQHVPSYLSREKNSRETQYKEITSKEKEGEQLNDYKSEDDLKSKRNKSKTRLLSPIRLAGVSVSNLRKGKHTPIQPSIDDIYEKENREPTFNNNAQTRDNYAHSSNLNKNKSTRKATITLHSSINAASTSNTANTNNVTDTKFNSDTKSNHNTTNVTNASSKTDISCARKISNSNKLTRIRRAEQVLDEVKEKYGENIANLGI